jgi:hypothetical protein
MCVRGLDGRGAAILHVELEVVDGHVRHDGFEARRRGRLLFWRALDNLLHVTLL